MARDVHKEMGCLAKQTKHKNNTIDADDPYKARIDCEEA